MAGRFLDPGVQRSKKLSDGGATRRYGSTFLRYGYLAESIFQVQDAPQIFTPLSGQNFVD